MVVVRKLYLAILGHRPQASAQPGNGKLYLAILGHRPQATIPSTAQYSATGHDSLDCMFASPPSWRLASLDMAGMGSPQRGGSPGVSAERTKAQSKGEVVAYVTCYLFVHSDTLGLVTVSDNSARLAANTVGKSYFYQTD